jgi:hypothetical protein
MTTIAIATKPVTAISLTAARLSIAATVTYQVLLVALLFIRRDVDPSWQTISVYAIGRHGWIMRLAFFISAVSYGALFVAFKSQIQTVPGRIGLGILLICVIGTVGAGVFVTDPLETPQNALSTIGTLHVITASIGVMLLPFAALLVNLSLARKNKARSSARRVMLWTAGLPMLGLAGFGVATAIEVPVDDHNVPHYGPGVNIGWPPRIVFLIYTTWLIAVAWQLIKRHREKP